MTQFDPIFSGNIEQPEKKVLLIDGDPQGSLTISLGHPQPDKLPVTLSDMMGKVLTDTPILQLQPEEPVPVAEIAADVTKEPKIEMPELQTEMPQPVPNSPAPQRPLIQADIDASLQAWNGDIASKPLSAI